MVVPTALTGNRSRGNAAVANATEFAAQADRIAQDTKSAHAALLNQLNTARGDVARLNGVLETLKTQNEALIDALRNAVNTENSGK